MTLSHDPRSHRSRHRRPLRVCIRLLAAGTLITLVLPASALAANRFTVKAHFPNHTPTANRKWPIRLDVSRRHAKLSGSVRYEFKFDGTVVSHQPGHRFRHGVFRDKLLFPSKAVGEPLTLVVIVKTKYGTKDIDWAVKTRR